MPFDPPPAGEIAVAGVLGDPHNGFGGIPVTFLANIPGAVEMRVASTAEELALSDWRAYSPETEFWMRTGYHERTIYAEFRDSGGTVTALQTIVPAFDESLGTNYAVPTLTAIQPAGSPDIWRQDFNAGHEAWTIYDFNSGDPNGANVFYAASHHSTGGVNDSGYIWADNSRWLIDTPESPHSILALLTYPQWGTYPNNLKIDLNGTRAEFYLRGDDLDLKGGAAYFWVLDDYGRYKQYDIQLAIGDGTWAFNSIDLGADQAGWVQSWSKTPGAQLDFTKVWSWGIGFVGFTPGVEPTGVLALDEFTIARRGMSLTGTTGADTLVGGRGDDVIAAGDGADTLTGGDGNDQLLGGLGDDRYYIDPSDSITELAGGGFDIVYSSGSHTLGENVEAVYLLGPGNFVGTGTALANWIYGNAGNDHLEGLAGNDLLDGGAGDDLLVGGADHDWLRGGAGSDNLAGGDGNDSLEGGEGNDYLNGGAGNDILNGGAGDDEYWIDAGDTIIDISGLDIVHTTGGFVLAPGIEAVYMEGPGSLTGLGNSENNWIYGSTGNDFLFGYNGNDLLDGGAGNDVIDGGQGNDSLRGMAGDDRFIFSGDFGKDAIRGFVAGAGTEDRIQFSTSDFANFAAIQAATSPYLDGSRIVLGNNWVYLIGVDIATLHADDFLLV